MKKKLWITIVLLLIIGVIAFICGKISAASDDKVDNNPKDGKVESEKSAPAEYQFDATVLAIQDDYIMVEALEGQKIVGEVRVQIGLLSEEEILKIKVDDIIRITHDGKMTMSIPPQMTAVEEIIVIKK